ncbi:MAG: hypothetical protein SFX74_12940, partial [Fimbriimonadaceae bacterium]|nr:hypothetical protein [Fimbriimonadaceae bacterium]
MRHLIALVISALCALSLVSCAKKMRHKSLECSPSMAAPPGRKPHFIARCAVTPDVGIKHIRFAFFSKHGVDRFKTSARSISE